MLWTNFYFQKFTKFSALHWMNGFVLFDFKNIIVIIGMAASD